MFSQSKIAYMLISNEYFTNLSHYDEHFLTIKIFDFKIFIFVAITNY